MSSRESILEHALELFSQVGYRGTSMRELAQACGLTKPGLYHYFATKEAIFEALLESGLSDLESHLADLQDPSSSDALKDRLKALILRLLTLPKRSREVMRLSRQDLIHLDPALQMRFREAYQQRFTTPIAQILASENRSGQWSLPDCTRLFLSMILPFAQEETGNPENRAALLAHFFRNGLSREEFSQK
jgi:AcrR family transcriptional regulator